MAKWRITRIKGGIEANLAMLPCTMGQRQVEAILRHLACTTLTEREVIAASRPHRDPKRTTLLDRVGEGRQLCYGAGPVTYVATLDGWGRSSAPGGAPSGQ